MGVIVQMENIRKEFPGIVACDNISLELRHGEIHALLGENGAGKSTLMSVLFGLYQPDSGSIRVRGSEVHIPDPNAANRLGIGMVHQHFKLVSCFTVTENIILGLEPTRGLFVDIKLAAKRIKELSDRYGLLVDPYALISDISVGMQQRVEILKMLYRNADILIFDEPTAVLTPQEVQELTKIMSNLAAEGKSIFLITHKLREIKAMAQRCTVIRRGQLVGTLDVAEASEETLAAMMVGRAVSFGVKKGPTKLAETVLELEGVQVRGRGGVARVKNVSFSVRRGEILGLAGVDGNGQKELVEALVGLRRLDGGRILINKRDAATLSVRERIAARLAFIPDDRHKYGLILDFSLEENMILKSFHRQPFAKQGLLNFPAIRAHAQKVIGDFDVRSGRGASALARTLSGGNQQKAILGREIDSDPDLLVAVQPTRGLDVGAIEYVHQRLVEQRDSGKAVLLVSLELDEILTLSDRIAVISNGELVGIVNAQETDENEIGLMMTGLRRGVAK